MKPFIGLASFFDGNKMPFSRQFGMEDAG